jgi:hypothetical protein
LPEWKESYLMHEPYSSVQRSNIHVINRYKVVDYLQNQNKTKFSFYVFILSLISFADIF